MASGAVASGAVASGAVASGAVACAREHVCPGGEAGAVMGVERAGMSVKAIDVGGTPGGEAASGEEVERRGSDTASMTLRNDWVRDAGRVDCPEAFPAVGAWEAHLATRKAAAGAMAAAADGALEAVADGDHGRFCPRSAAAGAPT